MVDAASPDSNRAPAHGNASDDARIRDFLSASRDLLGETWVNISDETTLRFGENTLPGGDRRPAAIVQPGSTDEVKALVLLARRFRVAIHPISAGYNIGLGTRSAMSPGQVIIDLGRRMNRILEINEVLGYAVIEPGVTYQMLHDELVRRGNKFMIDCTSGPPHGSVLGNAMDRGAGYTPYFDHSGNLCGMEVVLGTGELIRTGDASLPGSRMWHVSKYSFGPGLDSLFIQSNFGVVTRAGLWLMPRPPATRSFHFSFPEDADFPEVIDLIRPLKLANFVPTLFRLANDMWLLSEDEVHPEYQASGGRRALSEEARRALRERHGLGAWVASGAFYGASDQALAPMIERVRKHFEASGKATYITQEDSEHLPGLPTANSVFQGIPTVRELRQLKWRPGGGLTTYTPGTPLIGEEARPLQDIARRTLTDKGLEYIAMWVCAGRFARGLHQIVFNREDENECRRGDEAYREMYAAFAHAGYSVGRAPIDYHDLHMSAHTPELRETLARLKQTFDPDGILSPGRYGIR